MRFLLFLVACVPEPDAPNYVMPDNVQAHCELEERYFNAGSTVPLRMLAQEDGGPWNGSYEQIVEVHHSDPVSLFLVGEHTTRWNVGEWTSGTVQEIYVANQSDATLEWSSEFPPDARVFGLRDHDNPGKSWDARGYRPFERTLARLGLELHSFHGCDEGARWQVGRFEPRPPEPEPDCGEVGTAPLPPDLGPIDERCPELAASEILCLTDGDALLALDPDTGESCNLGLDIPDVRYINQSLGWTGPHLFLCNDRDLLTRVDLRTDVFETTHVYCDAVTTSDIGLFTVDQATATVTRWPGFIDAQCARPASATPFANFPITMTTEGGSMWTSRSQHSGTAWETTTTRHTLEPLADESSTTDDHNIVGLAALSPTLIRLVKGEDSNHIQQVDILTGEERSTTPLTMRSYGLACRRR